MVGRVISNRKIKRDYFKVSVHAPAISANAQTGQFGMIELNSLYDPLLKRPMSFHSIDREGGNIDFLFQVVGKGTEMISLFKPGDDVKLLGPIGNGFKIKEKKNIFIVAGGIGVSPLFSLAEELVRHNKIDPDMISLLMGGQTKDDILCVEAFEKLKIYPEITTDDGSFGEKGLVTEPLKRDLMTLKEPHSAIIYTCGPHPMLHAVHKLAELFSVECQVSMESMMACGTGACLGCVIETKSENSDDCQYKTVCKDGPVFDSTEIIW